MVYIEIVVYMMVYIEIERYSNYLDKLRKFFCSSCVLICVALSLYFNLPFLKGICLGL